MPFDGTDLRNLQIARLQIFCEIARTHPYKSQKTFETCLAGEMWADPRLIELGINYARWNGVDRLPTFFGVTVDVLHILFSDCSQKRKSRLLEQALAELRGGNDAV